MNTDIELLGLAAKAAEIKLGWYTPYASLGDFRQIPDWNPLTDNGDALRLAVKLDISIDVNRVDGVTTAEYGYSERAGLQENHNDDPYAATRRAIVRAAAEIGKTK